MKGVKGVKGVRQNNIERFLSVHVSPDTPLSSTGNFFPFLGSSPWDPRNLHLETDDGVRVPELLRIKIGQPSLANYAWLYHPVPVYRSCYQLRNPSDESLSWAIVRSFSQTVNVVKAQPDPTCWFMTWKMARTQSYDPQLSSGRGCTSFSFGLAQVKSLFLLGLQGV